MKNSMPVTLMRNYVASLQLRSVDGLTPIRTIFSRNMLDADQVIEIASQFDIQHNLEAEKLFLSGFDPGNKKSKVFSLKLHMIGRKPLNIKEFRRIARLIGTEPILL